MATQKDWIQDVADLIDQAQIQGQLLVPSEIRKIIEDVCPFKKDVLYEPVGEVSLKLDKLISICNRIQNDI